MGDAAEAATIAGYQGTEHQLKQTGMRLLTKPSVMEAIKGRSRHLTKTNNVIASRDERMEMWTNIMNNSDPHRKEQKDDHGIKIPEDNIAMNMRLKASELLGKAEGDFIDRVDFSGKITISDVIQQSYQVTDKSLDAIEAEYLEVRDQKRRERKEEQSQIEYEDKPEDSHEPQSLGDLI